MAEINVERKKSPGPWIIAAIVVVLLIWALIEMMGRHAADTTAVAPAAIDPVATDPIATAPRTSPTTAPMSGDSMTTLSDRDAALDRYAGTFGSGNVELVLSSAGTYTMRESPDVEGQGQGRWSYDGSTNVLHLTPVVGSQDLYFRVEGVDTLTPLNPKGDPGSPMAPLQRVVDR